MNEDYNTRLPPPTHQQMPTDRRDRNVGMRRERVGGKWAIRDDGLVMPATARILALPTYRPYHGDPKASLEERMAYLRGEDTALTRGIKAEAGTFVISTATKDELIDFAMTDYGKTLDPRKDINMLRAEVQALVSS